MSGFPAFAAAGIFALAGIASGQDLGAFSRPADSKPIITPQPKITFEDPILRKPVQWEALHTFNPAAVVRDGKIFVLYRAEDNSGSMNIGRHTSRIGLAESADGVHFVQHRQPVFYPDRDREQFREWPGGVEDPRIVQSEDGTYILTYTQWNRSTYRIGIATSRDLLHWTKHGPAFVLGGKYGALAYKSAGILTHLAGDRLVAARVNGKYWMYWGEIEVRLATSVDLIHWVPVEGADGKPLILLPPRPGRFDSALPEVGPPPVLTDKGIVLLYNGKNASEGRDTRLAPGTYAAGRAIFDADNPAKLVSRSDKPFFQPEMPWERSGQYAAGTTFLEGLVRFHEKWFLYYGCADSFVGVAFTEH